MKAPSTPRQLWWHYTLSCGLGELLGIALAAGLAVLLNETMGEPQGLGQKLVVLAVMLCAGALEGSSIAWFQWRVMRHKFPRLPFRAWWRATVAVALLGWFLGQLPPLFFAGPPSGAPAAAPDVPLYVVALGAAAAGLLAGGLFGTFQQRPLRQVAEGSRLWIWGNVAAWAVALAIIYAGATWPDAQTPLPLILASGVLSGLLAGLAIGAITGLALLRMLPKAVVAA